MPGQQRFGRDHDRYLSQQLSSESFRLGCQAATLPIGEPKPPVSDLGTEDSILFPQVIDRVLLLLIDPSG
jgi:hypothetical protein